VYDVNVVAGKLDRALVVRQAMLLLDEVGLDALSLRRLAGALGVQAPALYRHFADKGDLLRAMADSMFDAELAVLDRPQPGADWADWLIARSRALRTAMLAHRDGGRLKEHMSSPANQWPGMELLLQTMEQAGFTVDEAMYATSALGHHILGCVIAEQEARRFPAPPTAAIIDPRRFPRLASVAAHRGPARDYGTEFEYGLHAFVTGLRAQAASRGAGGAHNQ
jgi:TetR/AcrR family tetracycline transcriptional repressor